jgi:hypothetical protein
MNAGLEVGMDTILKYDASEAIFEIIIVSLL